ncbi:hypothetical protein AQUCO_07200029v1 [Aquilegia coerulea]|uniref:Transcription repressor n=1 Tax=Aquilegia coerulea TaxID=218851 RepID=A0A2G5CA24_AQUCA|nr:hypothetical protein AQUCO_07200029v1 [Aquilegia coerulea]
MSSITKKKLLHQNTVAVVDIGCGCGRPKFSNLFFPKLKSKLSSSSSSSSSPNTFIPPKPDLYNPISSSEPSALSPSFDDSTTTFFDTTPFHSESEETSKSSKSGFSRIGESVAVVKDSNDPYLDFRHSMLQMILEKEIYSKDELKELLDCFLSLNSPYHHEIIIRAFTEIWNGVFSMGAAGQSFSAVSSRVRRKSREF